MFKKLVDKAKEKLEEQNAQLQKLKEKATEKLHELNDDLKEKKDLAAGKIGEVGSNIKDLKTKATEKMEETGERLKEAKQKVSSEIGAKASDLRDMKDKAMGKLTLEHLLPEVRTIISAKVVPLLNIQTFGKALGDDKKEAVFRTAYEFLPAPIRLLVNPDTFIKFCLSNKGKILDAETEQKLLEAQASHTHFSAADEILKLKELLDSGVLTEDEFASLKQQLV